MASRRQWGAGAGAVDVPAQERKGGKAATDHLLRAFFAVFFVLEGLSWRRRRRRDGEGVFLLRYVACLLCLRRFLPSPEIRIFRIDGVFLRGSFTVSCPIDA